MHDNVIQSLWIGNTLSNNERLCLHSYAYHRQAFHLYAYNDIPGIPPGITVKDANAIIPAVHLFKDTYNSYASFADWFRLKLLQQQGGWWVDMDTVCLRPFDVTEAYCFSSEWEFSRQGTEVNNTYVKSPAGAPYLQALLDHVEQKLNATRPVRWGEVGVYLFREVLHLSGDLAGYIREPAVFCPVNYFDLSALICKSDYTPGPETLAVHLWNDIWRRAFLDKNATYHPDSLYERLKNKYLADY